MKSIEALLKSKKTVFSVKELKLLWDISNPATLKSQITYLIKVGKLRRIKQSLYVLPDIPYDIYELANKVKTPSYISFETILYNASYIFQPNSGVMLASNNSLEIEVDGRILTYRKLKDEILFNKEGIVNKGNYSIASNERAVLDMIYLNKDFYFDNLNGLDFEKCFKMTEIYNSKTVTRQIHKLAKRYV